MTVKYLTGQSDRGVSPNEAPSSGVTLVLRKLTKPTSTVANSRQTTVIPSWKLVLCLTVLQVRKTSSTRVPLEYTSFRAAELTKEFSFHREAIKAVSSACFHLVYKCGGHGLLSSCQCAASSTALSRKPSVFNSITPTPSTALLWVVTGC